MFTMCSGICLQYVLVYTYVFLIYRKEIEDDSLGSRPLGELLVKLKPQYWFAAHLHVKFAAHVLHQVLSVLSTSRIFMCICFILFHNVVMFIGNRLFYFQTNPINKKHLQKKSEVK